MRRSRSVQRPRRNYAQAPAFAPENPGLGMPMLCPSQNFIPGYGTARCERCREADSAEGRRGRSVRQPEHNENCTEERNNRARPLSKPHRACRAKRRTEKPLRPSCRCSAILKENPIGGRHGTYRRQPREPHRSPAPLFGRRLTLMSFAMEEDYATLGDLERHASTLPPKAYGDFIGRA